MVTGRFARGGRASPFRLRSGQAQAGQPRRLSPHGLRLGDVDDCAFGADCQGAAFGIGADGVELGVGFFLGADAGGILGRAKIVDEFGSDQEEAAAGFVSVSAAGIAIVGYGGVIRLRENFGEGPGFTGVGGEGEVGTVSLGKFVISTGDYAVSLVAEGDGEDSGGIRAAGDGSIEDFPGAAAVRGVEDAGGFAASGEPNVGVGLGRG